MIKKAYFAAGCFWGVEYHFENFKGVISAISGYMGGKIPNPSYEIVCSGFSGHLEAVEVTYEDDIVNFEELTKLFFEIHDFTQTNGQGPDIGTQYLSAIFYVDVEQKSISEKLIDKLKNKGYKFKSINDFIIGENHIVYGLLADIKITKFQYAEATLFINNDYINLRIEAPGVIAKAISLEKSYSPIIGEVKYLGVRYAKLIKLAGLESYARSIL